MIIDYLVRKTRPDFYSIVDFYSSGAMEKKMELVDSAHVGRCRNQIIMLHLPSESQFRFYPDEL